MLSDFTAWCRGYDNKNSGKNWKVQLRILMFCFSVINYLDIISRAKCVHFLFLSRCLVWWNSLCPSLLFHRGNIQSSVSHQLKKKILFLRWRISWYCKDLQASCNFWPHSLNEKHNVGGDHNWTWESWAHPLPPAGCGAQPAIRFVLRVITGFRKHRNQTDFKRGSFSLRSSYLN